MNPQDSNIESPTVWWDFLFPDQLQQKKRVAFSDDPCVLSKLKHRHFHLMLFNELTQID